MQTVPVDRSPLTSGRDAAIRHLAQLASRYPDLVPLALQTEGLEPREAALAHTIVDHAVRRWLTIEHLVRISAMREPAELEPRMRAVILAGATQLLFLDRIPSHAALDESVEWAKTRIRPGAGAMTNAILRRVSELRLMSEGDTRTIREKWTDQRDEIPLADGRALVMVAPVLPSDEAERLSISTSMPLGMLRRWGERHGRESAIRIALHGLVPPPIILNASEARNFIPPSEDDGFTPHAQQGFYVLRGDRSTLDNVLRERKDVWVQDPASAEAVRACEELRPRVIVDACAGRGTKTRQLRARFPDAHIIATDTDRERLVDLRAVFRGDPNVRVVRAEELWEVATGRADLILLDVPCSNTGVLGRRPEARFRAGPEQLERLNAIQRQIFADCIRLRAPGGSFLYSTCSLEREENDDMMAWARRWHELRTLRTAISLPMGVPGEDPAGFRDGSFWALLR